MITIGYYSKNYSTRDINQVLHFARYFIDPNMTLESFLALAQKLPEWLRLQPGFIAYELYEENGGWSERVIWENSASSINGQKAFLQTQLAQSMLPMVNRDQSGLYGMQATPFNEIDIASHEPLSE